MEWTLYATEAMNHLTCNPRGCYCLESEDLRSLLLMSGGFLLTNNKQYNIETKYLGVDVWRVTLSIQ